MRRSGQGVDRALKFAGNERYKIAGEFLEKIIASDTSLVVGLLTADFSFYAVGLDSSLASVEKLGRNSTKSLQRVIKARLFYHTENWNGVYRECLEALNNGSSSNYIVEMMVEAAVRLSANSDLGRQLKKLQESSSQKMLYDFGYAKWRALTGNNSQAQTSIESFLQDSPESLRGNALLGQILFSNKQYHSAIEKFQIAMRDRDNRASVFLVAETLPRLIAAYFETEQADSAKYYAAQVLKSTKEKGLLRELLAANQLLAPYYRRNGFIYELKELCSASIAAYSLLSKPLNPKIIIDSAFCMAENGKPEEAIATYTQAYDLIKVNWTERAEVSLALGRLHLIVGKDEQADFLFQRARAEAEKGSSQALVHEIILELAALAGASNKIEASKRLYRKVLAYSQRIQDYDLTELCFIEMAQLYLQPPAVLEHASYFMNRADALARQTFRLNYAANHRWMQGEIALLENDVEQAETLYHDAIELGEETGSYMALLAGEAGLIRTYMLAGFPEMASEWAEKALKHLYEYLPYCQDEFWVKYFDLKDDLFEPAIHVFASTGQLERIYYASDMYKMISCQIALKQLPQIANSEIWDEYYFQKKKYAAEIAKVWESLWSNPKKDATVEMKLKAEINRCEAAFDSAITALERDPLALFSLRPNVLPIAQTQSLLKKMNSTYLHYFVGRDATYAIVITSKKIYCKRIRAQATLIRDLVSKVSPLFNETKPNGYGERYQDFQLNFSGRLYKLLVEPLEPWLKGAKKIMISTDGPLTALPFGTLVTNLGRLLDERDYGSARFLIEKYAIFYHPFSALVTESGKSVGKGVGILTSGNIHPANGHLAQKLSTGLNDSDASLNKALGQLRSIFGRRLVSLVNAGSKTDFAMLDNSAVSYNILHSNIPYKMIESRPLETAFTLSETDNKTLSVHELYDSRINARLLVIQNGTRKVSTTGNGLDLTTLFHAARFSGVKSLMLNLWRSDEVNSPKIQEEFYKNLKQGMDKVNALRQSKLSFLKGEQRNPYYWGGTILLGEPDPINFETNQTYIIVYITIVSFLLLVTLFMRQFHKLLRESK